MRACNLDMTITTMTWARDDAPRFLPPNQRNTLSRQMQNQQNEQSVNPAVIKAGRQAMEVCLPAARTPCPSVTSATGSREMLTCVIR